VGIWTRITHWLNVVVWALPLPRKVQQQLSAWVYRSPPIKPERVAAAVHALESAGVTVACMGGWATSAVAGRQVRTHRDLDVVIDSKDAEKSVAALQKLGFEEWYRLDDVARLGDGPTIVGSIVLRDRAMEVVDLNLVDAPAARFTFVTGTVAGQPVPTLSPEDLLRSRSDRDRRRDRKDREVLRGLVELDRSGAPRTR
jgi:lincosamide nucleotidyltransferase A/C/D/E